MSKSRNDRPSRTVEPQDLRRRLSFSDAQLLAECQVHRHRSGGPGGQQRNKVASAIRLQHRPSGLVAGAHESRLQQENLRRALRRLRIAIALAARVPLPGDFAWPPTVQPQEGRLRIREGNAGFPEAAALVLDAVAAAEGRLADAAALLGLTTSGLTRFLKEHPALWREVCRMRQQWGLGKLR